MEFKLDQYEDVMVINVYLTRATLKHAGKFKDFVFSIINSGWKKVIVDLSASEYIDSTFMGGLVAALKKLVSSEGDLRLIYSSKASMIFDLTGMNRVFKIHTSLEDALKGFSVTIDQKKIIPKGIPNNKFKFR
ncbi:STAS domain-containing protein [Bacteroidota bacterium]